jgi:Flp pilus assembly protein TadD
VGHEALLENRNEEAARWLHDAATLQPRIPQYWFNLGIAYHRLGNRADAIEAYQRAHELEPNNPAYAMPKLE